MMNDIPNSGKGAGVAGKGAGVAGNNANSANLPHSQKIEAPKLPEVNGNPVEVEVENDVDVKSTELPNVYTAGRSLVFTDNIEQDLKMLQENPQAVYQAMKFFDKAYEQNVANNVANPYENAAATQGAFVNEFAK